MLENIKNVVRTIRDPMGKSRFLRLLPANAHLLDVGCGNHSPESTKKQRPDIYYVGIDIGDYNTDETSKKLADKYILTTGENFSTTIRNLDDTFDAAISSHNLEHCNHPMETIDAICSRLRSGGGLYLAFPCENSVNFPSRINTLNFYDDSTHIYLPNFHEIMKRLIRNNNMSVDRVCRSYRPIYWRMKGWFLEVFTKPQIATIYSWSYYGFETIIWAHKK